LHGKTIDLGTFQGDRSEIGTWKAGECKIYRGQEVIEEAQLK